MDTQLCQLKHDSKELLHVHGFWICMHWDRDLGDMAFAKGHDTSLDHEQQ